jgi:hypothetical protein
VRGKGCPSTPLAPCARPAGVLVGDRARRVRVGDRRQAVEGCLPQVGEGEGGRVARVLVGLGVGKHVVQAHISPSLEEVTR